MKKIRNAITVLFITLFISVFSIVGHPLVSAATAHDPITHTKTTPGSCASTCLSIPSDKSRAQSVDEEDEDPEPRSYLLFTSTQTGWFAEKQISAQSIDLPDKIPKYRLCCVVRR